MPRRADGGARHQEEDGDSVYQPVEVICCINYSLLSDMTANYVTRLSNAVCYQIHHCCLFQTRTPGWRGVMEGAVLRICWGRMSLVA